MDKDKRKELLKEAFIAGCSEANSDMKLSIPIANNGFGDTEAEERMDELFEEFYDEVELPEVLEHSPIGKTIIFIEEIDGEQHVALDDGSEIVFGTLGRNVGIDYFAPVKASRMYIVRAEGTLNNDHNRTTNFTCSTEELDDELDSVFGEDWNYVNVTVDGMRVEPVGDQGGALINKQTCIKCFEGGAIDYKACTLSTGEYMVMGHEGNITPENITNFDWCGFNHVVWFNKNNYDGKIK